LDVYGSFFINSSVGPLIGYNNDNGTYNSIEYNVGVKINKSLTVQFQPDSLTVYPSIKYVTSSNDEALIIDQVTATNLTCADRVTISDKIEAPKPLLTVGNIVPTIVNENYRVLIDRGGLFTTGPINCGSITYGTSVNGGRWADISAVISTELLGAPLLDITAGVSGHPGVITSAISDTYLGYAGNYLNPIGANQSSLQDVIYALNMVIATQNRIINALRNNKP